MQGATPLSQFPHLEMEIVMSLGGLNEVIVEHSDRAPAVTVPAALWLLGAG